MDVFSVKLELKSDTILEEKVSVEDGPILQALEHGDWNELRRLSLRHGGFGEVRRKVW